MGMRGLGLVVVATSLWGTLGPFERIAFGCGVSPLGISLVRGLIASACVSVYAAWRRPNALRFVPREAPALACCGLFGMGGLYVLSNVAMVRIPVGLATLLFYLAPFWTLLGARLLGKERLTLSRGIALGTGLLGLWLALGGTGAILSERIDGLGALCAVAGGASYAVYLLVGRYGVGERDPFRMYLQTFLWGTLFLLAGSAWTGDLASLSRAPLRAWGVLAWLGIFPTILSYALLVAALRSVSSTVASIASMTEIAWAMLWAFLLLGERPRWEAALGGCLIALGAAVLSRDRADPPD